MQDPTLYLTIALAGLAGLSIVTMATLRGWTGWLELKRAELGQRSEASAPPSAAARIEVADLKERIRKLEAIAAGVDL
ncbi:hypothetical protein D0Z70_01925 [Sphingobium terrigena]|uniref:Uncharacterized protein n=1 Tax=Sphingobium terrigena TaxID=2304063 RepID=A0A418YYN7_9SPHN|nr:hypothetical protein [Sphingobium terrigena]RJG57981.1 hypothetical protein D0Z70_01925 [Sphingobium terrigena]